MPIEGRESTKGWGAPPPLQNKPLRGLLPRRLLIEKSANQLDTAPHTPQALPRGLRFAARKLRVLRKQPMGP